MGWFDPARAETFTDARDFDGSNMRSRVAPWGCRQTLHLTAGGRWVLSHSSQWVGDRPWAEYVTPDAAREWLLVCDHDEAVDRHFGPVADESGPTPARSVTK